MTTGRRDDEETLDASAARKAGLIPARAPEPEGPTSRTVLAVTSGRYKLGDQLGAGGMGVVLEARDAALDRVVAVKKLRPDLMDDEELRDRFLREAWVMAQLDHPGVLPVYELGATEDGSSFYAMKRVRGRTLRELLAARPQERLKSRDELLHLTNIFERAVEAVAAAHVEGFVHRDLKPENIMVDRFGSVFVMDWGIARRVAGRKGPYASTRTEMGVVIGSPGYMSPEQARGDSAAAGFASDVFALGTLLYEILTGEAPFRADTLDETLQKVRELTPPDPRHVNPAAPRALAAICEKAMAKDAAARYATAADLATDLRNFREGRPVSAAPERRVDRAAGWARRNPALASVAATLALLGLALALAESIAVVRNRRAEAKGLQDAAEHGQQVARLEAETRALRAAAAGAGSPEEKAVLEVRARSLEGRQELLLLLRRIQVWGLLGRSRGEPDEKVKQLVREQVRLVAARLLREGKPEGAREIATWARMDQTFRTLIAFTPEELDLLETDIARAEARRTAASKAAAP